MSVGECRCLNVRGYLLSPARRAVMGGKARLRRLPGFPTAAPPRDEVLSDDPALDLWVRQTVGTSRDVSGTCKIGPDADPMAVVDQECRVKGVTGLWVADSSVMPHVVRANTNATAIMIGERVADWVGNS